MWKVYCGVTGGILRPSVRAGAIFSRGFDDGEGGGEPAPGPRWGRADVFSLADEKSVAALGDAGWLAAVEGIDGAPEAGAGGAGSVAAARDAAAASAMVDAYRVHGHLAADLDPLRLVAPPGHADLSPARHGFREEDLDREVFVGGALGLERATVRCLRDLLERVYCSTIGAEFMHVSDPSERDWLRERVEQGDDACASDERLSILGMLIETSGLERFLDLKYKGVKRFGLDGAEAMLPALEGLIGHAARMGVEEVVIGMAHRGRLELLTQLLAKPLRALFSEFSGKAPYAGAGEEGSGDVKYHLGASRDRVFGDRSVHLSLVANPSHLESVDPIVLGKARAKQDLRGVSPVERGSVLPLLIHGDAAFAGQGVVAECFGLSGLSGYGVGGTVHFIVNNRIGFTAPPSCSRSSVHPSDLAKNDRRSGFSR